MKRFFWGALCASALLVGVPVQAAVSPPVALAEFERVAFDFTPGSDATNYNRDHLSGIANFDTGPFAVSYQWQFTGLGSMPTGISIGFEGYDVLFAPLTGRPFDLDSITLLGESLPASFYVKYTTFDGQSGRFDTSSLEKGQSVNFALNLKGLTSFQFGAQQLIGNVTISRLTGATIVPEAATWVSMFVGFGLMGFTLRRRSKPVKAGLPA